MSDRNSAPFSVHKFGGTSVARHDRWETIVEMAASDVDAGRHPVLVCSAVSGTSDVLEELLVLAQHGGDWREDLDHLEATHRELADDLGVDFESTAAEGFEELARFLRGAELIGDVGPKLHARVMARGELMATRIGAAYLRSQGLDVEWIDARDHLVSNEEPGTNPQRAYLSATCEFEPDAELQRTLHDSDADLHVTQGFIAKNDRGETVLLGRGGSDTSAAYVASKLEADRLDVWTDVPGMFTANPRQVPSARLLTELDYEEGQELATMGAEVLHPRCIDPVRSADIPLRIQCIDAPDAPGTRISGSAGGAGPQVKAISAKSGMTLISMETLGMWQEVGFLADAFECFRRHGLSVDLVTTSETNVTVSLDPKANALDEATIDALLADLNEFCDAREIGPCAVVSLVGRHIRSILHELGPALEVFDEQYVYLVSQAASDLNFSFVVDEDQADRLVTELHALLFGERRASSLFGPSWEELTSDGDDGAQLPDAWWVDRRDELLEITEDGTPVWVYSPDAVHNRIDALDTLDSVDRTLYAVKANDNPDLLRLIEDRGLGFECVSPGEVELILELFPEIDRSRVLFTPNFAPRTEYREALEAGVHVTVDSLHPLAEWPELFEDREIFLRFDPGRGRGHHEYVRTGGPRSKFGIAPGDAERARELVESAGARVEGLHAHLGSDISSPEVWAETGVFLAETAELFPDAEILDVGGGLGVSERAGQPPLDLETAGAKLESLRELHPGFELWLEPGRFLVADAGVLLAEVTQLKQKQDIQFVGVDTGMNSLVRPALYGAHHDIENLSRLGEAPRLDAEIVGPICESGDVLGHDRRLPATREGDVLLVAQTGAYGRVMSSEYNRRSPGEEVVLGE